MSFLFLNESHDAYSDEKEFYALVVHKHNKNKIDKYFWYRGGIYSITIKYRCDNNKHKIMVIIKHKNNEGKHLLVN